MLESWKGEVGGCKLDCEDELREEAYNRFLPVVIPVGVTSAIPGILTIPSLTP